LQTIDERSGQGGGRFRPGRGLTIAGIFIGGFLVLQLAETVWRHFAPPPAPPPPRPAAESRPEEPPTVSISGDIVTVEAAGDRTNVRLEYGDDADALMRCLRTGIDEAMARPADGSEGGAPAQLSRREIRDRVHEVTRRCIDEANSVVPPEPPPLPPDSPGT
jgi:hypothetical protein